MPPILDNENNRSTLEERISEVSSTLTEQGIPLEYSPIVREMAVNAALAGNWDDVSQLLLPYNEEELYEYIRSNPQLGIKLYSPDVEDIISIDLSPPRIIKEDLFSLIVNEIPETYSRIRSATIKPVPLYMFGRPERGIACLVEIDGTQVVIKTTQNGEEELILAKALGDIGLTPKIFEGTEKILVEEYIKYPSLRKLLNQPELIGNVLGRALYTLQLNNIVYGDTFVLSGHLRLSSDFQDFKLIDLGTSSIPSDHDKDWERAITELEEGCYADDSTLRARAIRSLVKWRSLAKIQQTVRA